MATPVYQGETKRGEGRITKARRLLAEGAVEHVCGSRYKVRGDSGTHHLMVQGSDVACSCKCSAFGDITCSHALAIECFLSAQRRAS